MSTGSIIDSLLERLGPAVLLPIPAGAKCPKIAGWERISLIGMQGSQYRADLERAPNIGVLLGSPSGGLCTVDVDGDEALEEFITLNPKLSESLRTQRARGGNVWVRIRGDFPKLYKLHYKDDLRDEKGNPQSWGEWRANGGQTVIYGSAQDLSKGETEPIPYRFVVDGPPVEIAFEEIVWPDNLRLPWLPEEPVRRRPRNGPYIILPSGEVTIQECAGQVFTLLAKPRRMFTRGGVAMELVRQKEQHSQIGLDVLKASALRSRIEAVGRLMKWGRDNHGQDILRPAFCSTDMAQALLDSEPARELLPTISVVTGCPVATQDANGDLRIIGKGYDGALGGVLVTSGQTPTVVPAAEAVNALSALLDDFEFQTPSDRARALASFISPALAIGGFLSGRIPADVAEADQSQAGKGYRQKVIAAIYGEVPAVVAQRKNGVGGIEESFQQALISGRPFVQLDNLRGGFDSQFFEAFFTADTIGARVPHKAEVQVDPRRFFIFATSNGVDTTQDFANRSCFVRIRKRVGHCFRSYPEGELLYHVRTNRTFYLCCLFGIISEWLAFGRPRSSETRHDFREWAQTADWSVQNIFQASPLLDGHQAAQERVSNPSMNLLRAFCIAVEHAGRLGETFTASAFAELAEENAIVVRGSDGDDHAKLNRQIGIQLRRVFKSAEIVMIDGYRVERTVKPEFRDDGRGERDVRYYTVDRLLS